jgi:hypothetical protein
MFWKPTIVTGMLLMSSALTAHAQSYKFRSYHHGTDSIPINDLNNSMSVGVVQTPGNTKITCFTQVGGTRTFLADPKQTVKSTNCNGINKAGTIVGNYQGVNGIQTGFVYSNGIFTDIIDPKGELTEANAINDKGVIVGVYSIGNYSYGFVFDGKKYRDVTIGGTPTLFSPTGINDKGQISGNYLKTFTDTYHGFLLDGKKLTSVDFPNATNTVLYNMNDKGEIAGVWEDDHQKDHGGVYASAMATYYTTDVPDADGTTVQGIDDQESLSGYYFGSSGVAVGFVAHGSLTK